MTRNEKIRYLKQYRECMNRIKDCEREKQQWFDIATNLSASTAEIHCQSIDSKVQRGAVEMASLEENICEDIKRANEKRAEILQVISTAPKQRYRILLSKRYIAGMSEQEIATQLEKCDKTIYIALRKAIDSLNL